MSDETETGKLTEIVTEKTFKLRVPITDKAGDVISEITLREPSADDIRIASHAGNGIDSTFSMISRIGKVPLATVGKLCNRDFLELSNFLGSFSDLDLSGGIGGQLSNE